jgi:hypothetical protein
MLNRFNIGDTYDMPQRIATYMILSGEAIAIAPTDQAISEVDVENRGLADELRESRAVRNRVPKAKKKR